MHYEKGDSVLKMSLNEIKGQIQVYPESWINMKTTNCYAYALGLDIKESDICSGAYQPGAISGKNDLSSSYRRFLYSNLIKCIETDLNSLDILYREINTMDKVELNEWKMALFVETYHKCDDGDDYLSGFHFLRTNQRDIWVHKPDYYTSPRKKDDFNQIITDPKECNLYFYEYKKCYALKLNKR